MSSSSEKRILVLASGRGSNFGALAKAIADGALKGCRITGLLCNKKDAPALAIAALWKIPATVVESRGRLRSEYETELLSEMKKHQPDLVCLAGYMRLLGPEVITEFEGRMVNIHPSLLPKFAGLHPQRQALDAGEKESGCTVHWVTQEMDAGPIIEQERVPVLTGDTVESLSDRILEAEHRTYVRAVRKIITK